jgi:pimeloyl-ACP methyl ester carboxylesterase
MRCRWRPSRWLTADLAAGSGVAAAVSLAVGLTPARAWQRQPEADVFDQFAIMLGLDAPERAAPPRGLSLWEARQVGGAEGEIEDAAAACELPRWRPLAEGDELPGRIVLLVHGLDEPGDIWNTLAPRLVDAGHTPVSFEYPNDQGARDSADELAAAMRALAARDVQRVDIVAHSMGGLIARDVLTREDLYAGAAGPREGLPRVGRLIMLGAPNAGSPWARLRILSELREQVMRFANAPKADRALAFLDDGLGEAGRDLLPGSDYLEDLNGRPLPQVPITLVIGRIAPGAAGRVGAGADDLARAAAEGLQLLLGADERARGAAAAAADELRRALELVEQTVGDGVVPAGSALLAGVDDVVYVEANHRGMVHTVRIEQAARGALGLQRVEEPPAIPVVLERLERNDE